MSLSASALRAAFLRSGAPGDKTGFFENAPSKIAAVIARALPMQDDNQPVLISWSSEVDWFVITPREVVVSESGTLRRVPITAVREVAPIRIADGRPVMKTDMTGLELRLTSGDPLCIHAEKGRPFSGVWNAVKAIERANTRP